MASITNTDKITNLTIQMTESLLILKQTNEKVDDLAKILKGNGHPGLVKRMDCLEVDWKQHKKECDDEKQVAKEKKAERHEISWKIILLVVGMIISNLGVIIFGILK